jgi:hypothetical protein
VLDYLKGGGSFKSDPDEAVEAGAPQSATVNDVDWSRDRHLWALHEGKAINISSSEVARSGC